MPSDQDRLEIERIDNLVRNFGWTKSSEQITDTDIVLTFSKPRSEVISPTGEGAD